MSVDLMKGARSDERFHIQQAQPDGLMHTWGPLRYTRWSNLVNVDGTEGRFVSWWVFNRLQLYYGTVKCDGTRTYMLNGGLLGDSIQGYVMTCTPKEMWAFRYRTKGANAVHWNDMGGS